MTRTGPRTRSAGSLIVCLTVAALSLTGCMSVIAGAANPADGIRQDVPDSDLQIFGAGDGDVDRLVRNALADINAYWTEQFPSVFGTDFVPLSGGYYSIDPNNFNPADYPDAINNDACLENILNEVTGNAFYCKAGNDGDLIVYDRTLLEQLMNDYGPFLPAMVLAHEFGHAVQARVGLDSNKTIVAETQADCYAGAWTGWVAADNAPHFNVRGPELDNLIRGLVEFRDPIGNDPNGQSSHGSYFDRASGLQEGFGAGPPACRDHFNDQRLFTEIEFQPTDTTGNAPYDQTFTIADDSLGSFWTDVLSNRRVPFSIPQLVGFDGSAPDCGGNAQERDIGYCPDDNSVRYDDTQLTHPVYDSIGDYAVIMAIAIPYSMAVLDALGQPIDTDTAVSAAVCLAGWYSYTFFNGAIPFQGNNASSVSPGDIDEAVIFLVEHGTRREVLPDMGLSGFKLVDYFRRGFAGGPGECGVEGLAG